MRSQFPVKLFAGWLCFAAGCGGPQRVDPTTLPTTSEARPGDTSTLTPKADPAIEIDPKLNEPPSTYLTRLARAVAAVPGAATAGCLPLVSIDARTSGPRVSQLGVTLADEIAASFPGDYKGSVLGPEAIAVVLGEMNVDRTSLSSLPAVAEHGEKLGVDAVVFGTIQREYNIGRSGRDLLTVQLSAYDVLGGKVLAQEKFELPSDRAESSKYFGLDQRESAWRPGNAYNVADAGQSLQKELKVATRVLAARAARGMDLTRIQGVVYVPPADTSRFVKSVARVRAAQAAFAEEFSRRAQEAEASGKTIDITRPMTLVGIDFRDLQAAQAYLEELREGLLATDGFIYGQQVSSMLAETLIPRLAPHEVKVNDIGFTKWSETQLVEGELATGGMARSAAARNAMKSAGIEFVAAPRFERYGKSFLLRLEVYDLQNARVLTTMHFPISGRFESELAKDLGLADVQPIGNLGEAERQSWDRVFPTVASGVVRLSGSSGASATGFVVSPNGHILTNAHVTSEIAGSGPTAMFTDGSTQPYTVVHADPFLDTAVVKVERIPAGTHVFDFAPAEEARVGREVAVLGHPRDTRGWVFSPGHLSSITESVPTTGGQGRPSYMYTCATRSGSSGSPVLLLSGKVVAVNSHSLTGVSFTRTDRTELTGFAFGVPGFKAREFFSAAPR